MLGIASAISLSSSLFAGKDNCKVELLAKQGNKEFDELRNTGNSVFLLHKFNYLSIFFISKGY